MVTSARTAAERQAAFRDKRATAGENGERRINTWVTTGTVLALARLAQRDGVTRRTILERLVGDADAAIVATLDPNAPEWGLYFRVQR